MDRQPSAEEARRLAAAAWLGDAEADLANARSLSAHRDEHTSPFGAAFHAQQAVEKALKALLIWNGIEYPPKHDLGLLIGLLPDWASTRNLVIAGLTVYAVEQRYVAGASNPMHLGERPSWEEADDAILVAEHAVMVARGDLDAAGWRDAAGAEGLGAG